MSIVEKEEWEKLWIAKINGWTLSVAANQHVLGWLIIFPPREIEESLVHLTDEELSTFKKIGLLAEDLLKECFQAEWFNYCQQGNNVKRIHIHLQPRYSSERVFEGHTFTDAGWGRTIRFIQDPDLAQKEIVFKLVDKFKQSLRSKQFTDLQVEIL
ncbi:MAG: hypothetical protein ACMG57_04975 [Candidatus Dojkabacteria bacterium]